MVGLEKNKIVLVNRSSVAERDYFMLCAAVVVDLPMGRVDHVECCPWPKAREPELITRKRPIAIEVDDRISARFSGSDDRKVKDKDVVAGAPRESVAAHSSDQRVVTLAAIERVVAGKPSEDVGCVRVDKAVIEL